jgi:hypothetical protein
MTLTTEQAQTLLDGYLAVISTAYPEGDNSDNAGNLKHVLHLSKIAHQCRLPGKRQRGCDFLQHFKTGRRLADRLFATLLEDQAHAFATDWQPCSPAANDQQVIGSLLHWVITEFDLDIWRIESAFPELKNFWDYERDKYFRMKTEAEEALSFD